MIVPRLAGRRLAAAALLALALTACGGQGTQTDCTLGGCTVTFERSGSSEVSVLGVSARLVGVDAGAATIEIAGQTVTVPVGGEAAAEGFTVGVQSVTDTEVVVLVRPGGGG